MKTKKNSQFVAASLGRGLHKLLIVVGSNGLESGIGVRLAQIPTDSCIVSDTQSAINMCPSQIWKPRFPNVKILEKGIELPEGTSQRYNFFLKLLGGNHGLCYAFVMPSLNGHFGTKDGQIGMKVDKLAEIWDLARLLPFLG